MERLQEAKLFLEQLEHGTSHDPDAGSNGGFRHGREFGGMRTRQSSAIFFCGLPLCRIGGAQMKHANRRLGIFEGIEAEILAGHGGFAGEHIFFSERALQGSSDAARQFRIVDGGGHIVRGDFGGWGANGGGAGGSGDGLFGFWVWGKELFALGGSEWVER